MLNSNHVDSVEAMPNALEEEGETEDGDVCKAQDLHTMLGVILTEHTELQKIGFVWDLPYAGRIYENI